MTPLARARAAGVQVMLDPDDRVVVRGPRRLAALLDEMLLCADEVRTVLRAEREGVLLAGTPAASSLNRTTGSLRLVRHAHRCRCGREFKCTAPSCAGRAIPCVVCRLR